MVTLVASGPGQMKILLLVPQLGRGGLELQVSYLAPALLRSGNRVCIAVWNYDPDEPYQDELQSAGIAVIPVRGRSVLAKLAYLGSRIRQWSPDIVHSYSFYTNGIAAIAAGRRPVVGSLRSEYAQQRASAGRVLSWAGTRLPRVVVTNSRAALEELHSVAGLSSDRTAFIPNGIDPARFAKAWRTNPEPNTVAGIGTLRQAKRWDRALRAVRVLRERGQSVRLLLAGDGPSRASLEELASQLKIEDLVEFLGDVDDPESVLGRASVLLLTSEREGSPNVVLEAMASRRPVVAADVGDVPFLLGRERGIVVTEDDIDGYADAIEALIRNGDVRDSIADAAFDHVSTNHSIAALAEATEGLYERLVCEGKGFDH